MCVNNFLLNIFCYAIRLFLEIYSTFRITLQTQIIRILFYIAINCFLCTLKLIKSSQFLVYWKALFIENVY